MFPDDLSLGGDKEDRMLQSPSPEIDLESLSARTTPEGRFSLEIPLVKYVKWSVPTGDALGDGEGGIRHAVPQVIPPDGETIKLKKSLSSRKRRSRKHSFEIGSAVDNSIEMISDSELDAVSKWQMSSRCSPISLETPSEKYDAGITAVSELYGKTCYSDCPSDLESSRISLDSTRRSQDYRQAALNSHRGCQRISDIAEVVHQNTSLSSADAVGLKILGSRGLNSRSGNYDDPRTYGERGFTISPLPTFSQLRAANAAHSFDSDTDSVSERESGYSDMMVGYSKAVTDGWAREADPPSSRASELQPRFQWLRRSVGPFTAIAGAFLVSLASM